MKRKLVSSGYGSSDSPDSSFADALITYSYLQQGNVRLHREVARLNQQLEWSNRLLTEAEKKLENAQSQPKLSYQFDHNPLHTRSRRISSHSQILPPSLLRCWHTRSLDDIHHELIWFELEHKTIAEMMEPGYAELPTVKLNPLGCMLRLQKVTSSWLVILLVLVYLVLVWSITNLQVVNIKLLYIASNLLYAHSKLTWFTLLFCSCSHLWFYPLIL